MVPLLGLRVFRPPTLLGPNLEASTLTLRRYRSMNIIPTLGPKGHNVVCGLGFTVVPKVLAIHRNSGEQRMSAG